MDAKASVKGSWATEHKQGLKLLLHRLLTNSRRETTFTMEIWWPPPVLSSINKRDTTVAPDVTQ